MKIIKHDKQVVIKTLSCVKKVVSADYAFYKLNKNSPAFDETCLYDFYACLDTVYLQVVGEKRNTVYNYFGTTYQKDKPNAWVQDIGFLPDKIDDMILDRKIKPEQAYASIIALFKQLVRIRKNHKPNGKNG